MLLVVLQVAATLASNHADPAQKANAAQVIVLVPMPNVRVKVAIVRDRKLAGAKMAIGRKPRGTASKHF